MTTPSSLTQTVSTSDSSSVTFVGGWQKDSQDSSYNIEHPSALTSVALTFHGTKAGAFGLMSFDGDTPLQGSIERGSGASTNFTQPAPPPHQSQKPPPPSLFYITDLLPCDEYTLTLFVAPVQSMRIVKFRFAPCLASANGSLPAATTTSAPASSGTPRTSAVAAIASRKPLSVTSIVGIVLGSLLLVLIAVVLLFFMLRRQRRRQLLSGSWSRLTGSRAKQSPSAQFLQSIGGGGGGGRDGEIVSRSRFGLSVFESEPSSPAVMRDIPWATKGQLAPSRGLVTPSPRGWVDTSVDDKPPLYSDDVSIGDSESQIGGLVVRGYLPDSKEWIASEGCEQERSESGTVLTNYAVESVPRYKRSEPLT